MTKHTVVAYNYDDEVAYTLVIDSSKPTAYEKAVDFAKTMGVTDTDDIDVLKGSFKFADCSAVLIQKKV